VISKYKLKTIFPVLLLAVLFFYKYTYSQHNEEKLTSDQFTSQQLNFSINFPEDNWTSSEETFDIKKDLRGKIFAFNSPYSETLYSVIMIDLPTTPEYWEDHFENVISGIEDFIEDQQSGWVIGNVSVSSSEIPMKNSKKFLVEFNIPDTSLVSLITFTPYKNGTNAYVHGYIISGKLTYFILTVNPDRIEPLMFTNWVKSFRLLNPKANEYKQDDRFIVLTKVRSIFLVVLLLTIILDIVFIIRKAMIKKAVSVSTESTLLITNKVFENEIKSKLTLWSKILIIVISIATFSIVSVKTYSKGLFYSLGFFLPGLILPLIIAFLVYGRKKNQDWNKFARLFFWLTLVLTLLSIAK